MQNKRNIFDDLKDSVYKANMSDSEKQKILKKILSIRDKKLNIMITGATGAGKSSTINALFDMEVAKVGTGVDPETMEIKKYELENMTLWDSPGLGDGKEADIIHSKGIIDMLAKCDNEGNALIDLVLVILDGGSRDLGTSYELINEVIIPNLGKDKKDRILVAINQCDVAMKGRYWNYTENKPEQQLIKFLDEKVLSVKRRIKDATGVDVEPIYYSAGYKEGNEKQNPYNLTKLLYYIIKHTPKEKRLIYANNMSRNSAVWRSNDNLEDYSAEVKKSMIETVCDYVGKGAMLGEAIGGIFGEKGKAVGRVVGAVGGAVVGFFKGLFD